MMVSHAENLALLQEVRDKIKQSQTVQDLCEEYGVETDYIDLIPMAFADLDVSARTDKGCIYFNTSLLDTPEELEHYCTHELTHHLQQCFGDGPTEGSSGSEDYLDNKYEQEGFQAQTEYISETQGDEAAEEYVEQVLDHHQIKSPDREKRKKDLLELASSLGIYKKARTLQVPSSTGEYLDLISAIVAGWTLSLSDIDPDTVEYALDFIDHPLPLKPQKFIIPLSDMLKSEYFNDTDLGKLSELEDSWTDITVLVVPDAQEAGGKGYWVYSEKAIVIRPSIWDIEDPLSLREAIFEARLSLRHEIQHAIQYLGQDITQSAFGYPPKKYQQPVEIKPEEEAFLHPEEFQTYLSDMINYLKDVNQDLSPADRKRNFNWFINENEFFKTLHKHDPIRYQKAVTELYKATLGAY